MPASSDCKNLASALTDYSGALLTVFQIPTTDPNYATAAQTTVDAVNNLSGALGSAQSSVQVLASQGVTWKGVSQTVTELVAKVTSLFALGVGLSDTDASDAAAVFTAAGNAYAAAGN